MKNFQESHTSLTHNGQLDTAGHLLVDLVYYTHLDLFAFAQIV